MTTSQLNMFSQNLLPIQQAVQMHLQHKFNFDFVDVARAFLLKYNIENRFCFTTIASTRQLDEDRFEIVRRMENVMSSKPIYERIIFNRATKSVQGYTFEKESENVYTEHYVYKQDDIDNSKTCYNMFLYKNPGLKKMLRFKLHNWGVQTLESIIKKEQEIETKIKESKDLILEKGEILIKEKTVMIKEKINDLKETVLQVGNKDKNSAQANQQESKKL
eukprot:403341536